MGRGAVRDDQLFALLGVLEEVVHAFALQPAGEELVVRLVELADVFALGVAAGQAEFEVGGRQNPGVLQGVGQKLGGGLVQEYLVVAGLGQPPQPGREHGAVEDVAVHGAHLFEARDHAVDRQVPAVAAEGEHRQPPLRVVELQIVALGDELHAKLVELAEPLGPGEAGH